MFLKLEYSKLSNALIIKGAETLNTLPRDLFELQLPVKSVITLLTYMRKVVLTGEFADFEWGNYRVYLSREVKTFSENTILIIVEEVKGDMSRPVFKQQFAGYYNGTKSLLTGIREFKGKVDTLLEDYTPSVIVNEEMVKERDDKIEKLVSENLKFFPDADESVLRFIASFLYHGVPEVSLDVSCESVRSTFRAGYCYYFAIMLRAAFWRGKICLAFPFSHIVWVDDNDIPYDVEGVYSGEAEEFIPIELLGNEIEGFKHVTD